MCLGVPARIVEVDKTGKTALVEWSGIKSRAGIELVREAAAGDFVLIHAGQALEKIDPVEAEARIKLWEEIAINESAAAIPGS